MEQARRQFDMVGDDVPASVLSSWAMLLLDGHLPQFASDGNANVPGSTGS